MDLERSVVAGGHGRAMLALVGGFVLAEVALLIGAFLTLNGHDGIGVGVRIADADVLVGAYVYGDWTVRRGDRLRESAADPVATRR